MKPAIRRAESGESGQVAKLFAEAADQVRRTLRELPCGNSCESGFQQARTCLDRLPLASADYGVVRIRLENARTFADLAEYGACEYELTLLANWLDTQATEAPQIVCRR